MRKFVLQTKFTNYEESAFKYYLNEIQAIKPLTIEEERELITKLVSGSEKEKAWVKEELVKRNLRFVISVAKQYVTANNLIGDLVNEGNLSLLEAVDRYDPESGYRFFSYAVWWIRRNMIIYTTKNRAIKLPHNKNFVIAKIQAKMDVYEAKLGRPATDEELEKEGFELVDIRDYFMSENFSPKSMDTHVEMNNDEQLCAMSETIDSGDFNTDANIMYSDLKLKVNQLLNKLKREKDRQILIKLFGLNGSEAMSISSVAFEMKMTTERIRQIKESSLRQLEQYSEILL